MAGDRDAEGGTASSTDRIAEAEPRAIEIAADTADLLAARAAALGISVSELIAALASDAAPPALPNSASPSSARGATDPARWREVRAWIDSWGKPDERPRPKFGK